MAADRVKTIALETSLIGLENTLMISVNEEISEQIQQSLMELENDWGVSIEGRTIFEIREETPLAIDKVDQFIARITESLKNITYLTITNIFFEEHGFTLRDVHYLGFDKNRLGSSLQYLMRSSIYHNKEAFFQSILDAASRQESSVVRRLICIMGILDAIGYTEGVAIIANYLYVGLKVS